MNKNINTLATRLNDIFNSGDPFSYMEENRISDIKEGLIKNPGSFVDDLEEIIRNDESLRGAAEQLQNDIKKYIGTTSIC
jgi:hypothetical protein